MDVKALAKSKRAHSQHHSNKKHHPGLTPKAPTLGSAGSSSTNRPSAKPGREKPHQSQGSKGALPSNWDRYAEDYGSGLEDSSQNNLSQATDVVAPKSKGADYNYLISEAKSRSEANISSESFPSFDDVLTDFYQGFGSLLSVRGEGIVSWTGDDNFIVEDKTTATHEASFLSLNLHLLAEQLEKVDLSQRLFIEPDLFLAESRSEEPMASTEESGQVQDAWRSKEMKKTSAELVHDYPNKEKLEVREAELDTVLSSFSDEKFFDSSNNSENYNGTFLGQQEDIASKLERTSISKVAPPQPSRRDSDLSKSDTGATNFDDELDDLLKVSSSCTAFSLGQPESSASLSGRISSVQPAHSQPSIKAPDISESAWRMKNFNDGLDDLLVETSSGMNNFGGISSVQLGCAQSSKRDENLSKTFFNANFDDELDDLQMKNFDDGLDDLLVETSSGMNSFGGISSVQLGSTQSSKRDENLSKTSFVNAKFDDELDDLLKETSSLTNKKFTSQSPEVIMSSQHSNTSSSSFGPVSKSKILEDFDSLFDTY